MLQWCARSGLCELHLWQVRELHLWQVRFQPDGCVGRLLTGHAPGLLSMARAWEASAREAHRLKNKKLSQPRNGDDAYHPSSTTPFTTDAQYSTITHTSPAHSRPHGSMLSHCWWWSRVPQPRLRRRIRAGSDDAKDAAARLTSCTRNGGHVVESAHKFDMIPQAEGAMRCRRCIGEGDTGVLSAMNVQCLLGAVDHERAVQQFSSSSSGSPSQLQLELGIALLEVQVLQV
jgi:hypothetical protein